MRIFDFNYVVKYIGTPISRFCSCHGRQRENSELNKHDAFYFVTTIGGKRYAIDESQASGWRSKSYIGDYSIKSKTRI